MQSWPVSRIVSLLQEQLLGLGSIFFVGPKSDRAGVPLAAVDVVDLLMLLTMTAGTRVKMELLKKVMRVMMCVMRWIRGLRNLFWSLSSRHLH